MNPSTLLQARGRYEDAVTYIRPPPLHRPLFAVAVAGWYVVHYGTRANEPVAGPFPHAMAVLAAASPHALLLVLPVVVRNGRRWEVELRSSGSRHGRGTLCPGAEPLWKREAEALARAFFPPEPHLSIVRKPG